MCMIVLAQPSSRRFPSSSYSPTSQPFFRYLGGEEDYWTHVRNPGYDFRRNGIPDRADATTENGNTSLYSTKLFRDEAVGLINTHAAANPITPSGQVPFFLYLPFQAVHSPLMATKHWLSVQAPLAAFDNSVDRRTYAAMVQNLDFAVKHVVDALNITGMWDNTVLIVSADNGGITPGGFNYPLRGQKATLWDGGMRGVGFIASPLLARVGYSYHGLMHVSDW
jgi:arylsulfatase A-like enzyme